MNKHEAIFELNSTVATIRGDVAYDINGNEVSYDADAVQTLMDSKAYISNRKNEYPDIGDQLDDLFKAGAFSTEMTATLQAVKDKYPKE